MSGVIPFPVWKTIKLGTGLKTADDFRGALQDAGFYVDEEANYILGRPSFRAATTEIEVDLVNVSVADLGFKTGFSSRKVIYERATGLDLRLCPSEVGPQLRLQHKYQPRGEQLHVGMRPIAGLRGDKIFFYVIDEGTHYSSGRQSLLGYNGGPLQYHCDDNSDTHYGDIRFIFVRPRN